MKPCLKSNLQDKKQAFDTGKASFYNISAEQGGRLPGICTYIIMYLGNIKSNRRGTMEDEA